MKIIIGLSILDRFFILRIPTWNRLGWRSELHTVIDQNNLFYLSQDRWFWRLRNNKVQEGYPMLIEQFWKGLPPRIDAAYERSDGKFVFFKGKMYYPYNRCYDINQNNITKKKQALTKLPSVYCLIWKVQPLASFNNSDCFVTSFVITINWYQIHPEAIKLSIWIWPG